MYGNAASTLRYLLTKLVLFGPPLREGYIRIIYTRRMVGKLVFNQDLQGTSGEVA